jgi:outer membrane protein OmpA-like peptidoglycan-associated protein
MVLIMKRISKIYIIGCLVLLSTTVTFGQKGKLGYADQQFELNSFTEAAKGYEVAFEKKASYRAAKGAALSYDKLAEYQDANKWWTKVVAFDEVTAADYSQYLASLQKSGNMQELEAALKASSFPNAAGNIHLDSLKAWYANPRTIELISLKLNSSAADYGIAFDPAGNTYLSSDRGAVSSSGKKSIRIDGANKFSTEHHDMTGRDFIKIYKEGENDQVSPVSSVVPKTFHLADPYFVKNQPVVFYTLTRDLGKVKKNRNYTIHPELYFSKVDEQGQWVDFKAFSYNSALEHGVITPFVDEQEKKLYFSSNRAGGLGGYDLYYVTYDDQWNFGEPVNLGPSINSAGDERDPYLSEGVFYFASDGHIGLGGLDLFQVKHVNGKFTEAKNLGFPYNSPQDDYAFRRGPDDVLYLSSTRSGGKGLDDLYRIEDLYRQFVGRAIDCEGNSLVEGLQVEMIQKDNGATVESKPSGNETFIADLSPDTDFQLQLNKPGYFGVTDPSLTTKGLLAEKLEKEYVMKKIPYKAVVMEEIIYYNFDDSKIRPDAEPVMRQVAELMKKYTFLGILVKSHTDSFASDEYNEALSQRRANAVRDFLGDYGIARSRVTSEWFGEQQLANDCGDGVPCPASAHQQNRRSELVLMAFPDENRNYEYPKELEGLDLSELKGLQLLIDCQ